MSGTEVERRLAAILAADVVGYSRLMGADEVGTLRALTVHRRELIDPEVAEHKGRIVKTTGDGVLAEFASAVEAVACAITIQRGLASRNKSIAEEKRLAFRIGINIGDIIIEANDIFGDGVNIAARLETLCEPGGLCISRAVRDQVRDKLPVAFDDLGEREVKNIARPVRVFGLSPNAIAAAPDLPQSAGVAATRRGRVGVLAAFAVVLTFAGAGGMWWLLAPPATTPRAAEGAAQTAAPVATERASIAVLPFASLTADGGSDYFADGLTEDIISALGRFRELSVMSRGAVSAYKSKLPTPEEVGRDLKVRYVLEGSVRRSPEQIRVSVSLTDSAHGRVLWSEKYDAEPKELFSVQDQITRRVIGALVVRVTSLELARAAAKPPNNIEAYDLVLRGRDLLDRLTRSDNAEARRLFERAIEIDPAYAPAYVGLGRVNRYAAIQGWSPAPTEILKHAAELARKAIKLDDFNAGAHALLGQILVQFGEYDLALDALNRAIDLNGSDLAAYRGRVSVLLWRGDTAGAIEAGEALGRLQPDLAAPDAFLLATAYVLADRGVDAVRILRQSLDRNSTEPNTNIMLAGAYAQAGQQPEAERQSKIVRKRFPWFSRDEFGSLLRDPSQREKVRLVLKKGGL